MLGTGARYAEYGITGGFFLCAQAVFLGLVDPDFLVWSAHGFGALLSESVSAIPQLAQPALQSLLVALALLSVFVTGLALEIVGSAFMLQEAGIFRKYLLVNQWMENFVQMELPHYAADCGFLVDLVASRRKVGLFGSFGWQRQVQQRLRRLENVLIAKVLASGTKTEMLAEQISICRMSRAIGTALFVVASEAIYVKPFLSHRSPTFMFMPLWAVVLVYCVPMAIITCGFLITRGAYSRYLGILFSLVYANWKTQDPQRAGGE